MAEDQKDRYIQYLLKQKSGFGLTGDAMRLVLEDFMVQMKELKDQMSSMPRNMLTLRIGCQKSINFANRLSVR